MKSCERIKKKFKSFRLGWLCCVLAVLCLTTILSAQSVGPVEIVTVRGALGNYFVEKQWTVRIPTITNASDKPYHVEVTCVGGEGPNGKQLFSRIVKIAPRSQIQVPVVARLENLKVGGKAANTFSVSVDYTLSDVGTGQAIQHQNGNVQKVPDSVEEYVFPLCQLGSQDYGSVAAISPLLTGVFGTYQNMQAPSPTLAYIPDRWMGYMAPKVVMIGNTDSQILRDSQVQALLDWTRRGGVLVLAGTEGLPELLQGQLAESAGVTAVGMHTISSMNVKREGGKAVGEFKLFAPLPMIELFPTTATVLYTSDSMPLMTRQAVGDGWIITLATPIAAFSETSTPAAPTKANTSSNALGDILSEIKSVNRIKPALDTNAFSTPGRAVLDQIGGDRGPARAVPVGLLLGLTAAVLLAGMMLRFKRRGEFVWLVLTPVAVLIGLGVWIYAASRSLPVRMTHVGLVSDAGDGTVRVQEGIVYGAGKNKEVKTFSAVTTRGDIRDIGKASTIGASARTLTEGPLKLPDQLVEPNSTRAFFLEAMLSNPGLAVKLTFGPDGLTGSVRNDLGSDLHDAIFLCNNRSYRLVGTFPTGQSGKAAISQKNLLGIREFITSESDIRTVSDNARQAMIVEMLAKPSINVQVASEPLLLGYIDRSMLNPTDNNTIPQQGWSLVVWPVEIVAPLSGTKVAIPSGFVEVAHARKGTTALSSKFPLEDREKAFMELKATLPPQVKGLSDAKGTLRLDVSAWTYKVTLSGLKKDGSEAVLASYTDPAGIQPEIPIANMADYQNADGSYRFRLKVEEASGKAGQIETRPWSLNSFDLALEGTSK